MNALEIAWAAGLFEGEGSVYPYHDSKNRLRVYPRVDIASTDEDVVRRFAAVVDGGAVYGPIQPKKYPTKKPFWRWQATGKRAERALALLAPYLGERRSARMTEVLAHCEAARRQREENV